jgi:hypothetical protein
MRCKVSLVLEGFPLHVWDTTVVEDLLGKSCAVDAVAPETKARAYMSLFKLSAWTSDMEAIPVASMLAVPEPVPGGGARPALARTAAAVVSGAGIVIGEVRTLQYRVLIHVVRVEKDVSEELGHAHSAPGRGHGGPREAGEGGGAGSLISSVAREELHSAASSWAGPRRRRCRRRGGPCQVWSVLRP